MAPYIKHVYKQFCLAQQILGLQILSCVCCVLLHVSPWQYLSLLFFPTPHTPTALLQELKDDQGPQPDRLGDGDGSDVGNIIPSDGLLQDLPLAVFFSIQSRTELTLA